MIQGAPVQPGAPYFFKDNFKPLADWQEGQRLRNRSDN
jgi:hypothetical protein